MKCNHPRCATQADCLLRFCPGCRAELYRFSARQGQLVAEPTPMAADARPWWFALVAGRVRRRLVPLAALGVLVGLLAVHRYTPIPAMGRVLDRLEPKVTLADTWGPAEDIARFAKENTPEDAIFSDALNHASIIDAIRLSKAQRFIFKHQDLSELREMLASAKPRNKLIGRCVCVLMRPGMITQSVQSTICSALYVASSSDVGPTATISLPWITTEPGERIRRPSSIVRTIPPRSIVSAGERALSSFFDIIVSYPSDLGCR